MKRSDGAIEATANALDQAWEKAKAEGREPTVDEFTAAINGVGERPKRVKREPIDPRWQVFTMWIWTLSYHTYLGEIEQAPGGFDPVLFGQKLKVDGYHREMCQKALSALREAIPLIESVLAEVEKQQKE